MASNQNPSPFLDRLAEEIRSRKEDFLVVLPNRRSLHVLSELIGDAHPQVKLLTVDDLMQTLAEVKLIDPEELLVAFYSAYIKVEKKPQSFDEFSKWAVTFLSDANDVDLYLSDFKSLFTQINEYHRTGEVFQDGSPGPLEQGYLSFWSRLPDYYQALKKELGSLGVAYRGWLYRTVAEYTDSNPLLLSPFFENKTVLWIGIIPGNPSEQKLIRWIQSQYQLEIFADVDAFYTDHERHEAGLLFRDGNFKEEVNWKVDLLQSQAYHAQVYPVSSAIGQVNTVKKLVDQLPLNERAKAAVILADERLLPAFLERMGGDRSMFNITTGFPLKNTLIHRFVMSWMQIHAGAIYTGDKPSFYYKHLQEFLDYALVKRWLKGAVDWNKLRTEIASKNKTFVSLEWLADHFKSDMFSLQAFDLLFEWPKDVTEIFQRMNDVLQGWVQDIDKLQVERIEVMAIQTYIQKLKLLLSQFNELLPGGDLKALRTFVHRQVGYAKLYLEEPSNDRIQVMGMLETRMIDFEHLFFIGANDDVLPGSASKATHIPFIHRKAFGLPTYKETEALIAYHFYRLLQRAKYVHFIYNQVSSGLSSGEPSRYLLQFENELAHLNPKFDISIIQESSRLDYSRENQLIVAKSPDVIDDIKKALKRLSPSALNTYVNSPLEFYFSKVIGVSEEKKVEEEMESSTFGTAVHNTLEHLYEPFLGKTVTEKDVLAMHDRVDELIIKEFLDVFDEKHIQKGKNYIRVHLAKQLVHGFLDFDAKDIKENGVNEMVGVELRLGGSIKVQDTQVNLLAFVDRIDKRNGKWRIIDYKTGKVDPKSLEFTWQALSSDFGKSKAMQLAFYKWAYARQFNVHEDLIDPVIYSFGNKAAGYQPLLLNLFNEEGPGKSFAESYQGVLNTIVEEMLNQDIPFQHREDSKYLNF